MKKKLKKYYKKYVHIKKETVIYMSLMEAYKLHWGSWVDSQFNTEYKVLEGVRK